MNKNKLVVSLKALLLVLPLMLTPFLSANAGCLKEPDRTLVLNPATVFENVCGVSLLESGCTTTHYVQGREKYKRTIKQGNEWLYADPTGGGITVSLNCRQFTISYGTIYEFPTVKGLPGSTEKMNINCTGTIKKQGNFIANCTGGTLKTFCYSNGICLDVTTEYAQIGRFR